MEKDKTFHVSFLLQKTKLNIRKVETSEANLDAGQRQSKQKNLRFSLDFDSRHVQKYLEAEVTCVLVPGLRHMVPPQSKSDGFFTLLLRAA